MAMDNSTIVKLIKKINFDLVDKFELTVTKELSFVPVNMQKNMATGESEKVAFDDALAYFTR